VNTNVFSPIPAPLALLNAMVADGVKSFAFDEAVRRAGRSRTATANLLQRLTERGLLDRVCRGRYAIRQLGVLGTTAAAEDIALAVGAAFGARPHRIAYRSALDEHDLISHGSRTIQVAVTRQSRIRSARLSDRPLLLVLEPEAAIGLGALDRDESWVSDIERALLDAAARPELAGGSAVIAEALVSAGTRANPDKLQRYAETLGWTAALRRLGSLADALDVGGLAGRLRPILAPLGDIDLEPRAASKTAWRDSKWWVLWPETPQEIASVARQ
jgi:predicted transcriptional regulator of viral defense system